MYVICDDCKTIVNPKSGKCVCGATEIKTVEEEKVNEFLKQYIDVPVSIFFLDTIIDYEKEKYYFSFIVHHNYRTINTSKSEEKVFFSYRSNKKVSTDDLIKAIQHYQMLLFEDEEATRKRIEELSKEKIRNRKKMHTFYIHKDTLKYITEEAKKYNITRTQFIDIILKMREQDEQEYIPE